jgi:hypothetical protein
VEEEVVPASKELMETVLQKLVATVVMDYNLVLAEVQRIMQAEEEALLM